MSGEDNEVLCSNKFLFYVYTLQSKDMIYIYFACVALFWTSDGIASIYLASVRDPMKIILRMVHQMCDHVLNYHHSWPQKTE